MYGNYLLTGHTIHSKSIKADTAQKYLLAAATFLANFDTVPGRDGRKSHRTDKGLCNEIGVVMKEARRYESVPNRKEAFTLAMQQALRTECKGESPDSLKSALTDWFGAGIHGGFRKNEWCQENKYRKVGTFNKSPSGDPTAFTLDDIVFQNASGTTISHRNAIANRSAIMRVTLRWRWQKNGTRMETKGYSRNIHDIKLDTVEAWLNIVERYYRIMPKNALGEPSTTLPVAVFKDNKTVHNITDTMVELIMRALAKSVYGITAIKELNKFTCHSIRVGACCILQAAGASPDYIKKKLRWNSDSWMIYTRDLCILAHQHNEIMFNESKRTNQRW